jgi:hypothetical protein
VFDIPDPGFEELRIIKKLASLSPVEAIPVYFDSKNDEDAMKEILDT